MAHRGYHYIWACILEVTSGSHAADLEIQTAGGVLKLHAEHFVFDIKENRLHLAGVTLHEPDGKRLVSFEEATFVDFVPGQKTVKGRIRGLRGRLTRMKDGSWAFEKYLTISEAEPSKVAFSVRLEDSALRFEDLAAPGSQPRWISSPSFDLDGYGDQFFGKGSAKIERAGLSTLVIRKQSGNKGIELEGQANLDLADLTKWLTIAPEGKGVDWLRSLRVTFAHAVGPWSFAITPSATTFRAQTSLSLRDLHYGEYRANVATAKGVITEHGFDGTVDASQGGTKAHFSGRLRWDQEFWMTGELQASSPNAAALPKFAKSSLPKGLTFKGGYLHGWMNYQRDFAMQGRLTADEVKYEGEVITNGRAWLNLNPTTTTVNLQSARYRDGQISGAAQITNGQLTGYVHAPKLSLGPVLRSYGVNSFEGEGAVTATISGTTAKPRVAFQSTGSARSTPNLTQNGDSEVLDLGLFSVRGSWFGDSIFVERATLEGSNGAAYAKGEINLRDRQLKLDLLAKEFPLGVVSKDVAGSASFSGSLTGGFGNLSAQGRSEVYGLKVSGQDLPVVIADLLINNQRLTATNLVGFRRSSRIEGTAYLDLKSNSIGGNITASGIQLGEWFPDRVAGILDVTKASIGGTLARPTLTASLSGRNLVAPGVKIDVGEGEILFADGTVHITQGTARSGTGVATGAGTYNLAQQSGSFDLVVQNFPLAQLLVESAQKLELDGTLSGKGTVAVQRGAFSSLESTGRINALKVGNEPIGSGTFTASHEGGKWSGSAMVGQLDSFVEITKLEAEPSSESLAADLTAFNIPISKLFAISTQLGLPEDWKQHLSRLEGRFDFGGSIGGKWSNPIIESRTLTLDELKLDGVSSGKLEAKFSRNDAIWSIERLTLTGPGEFNVTGTIDEKGDTKLEGSLNNVGSDWLSLLLPGINGVPGRYDISQFVVEGPTKSPMIQASLGFKAAGSNNRSLDIEARVSDGIITADGQYRVDGFTGEIAAEIPFEYPFKIAEHDDLLATLKLPERKLTDFEELWKGLDPTRTRGAISGEVQVKGRPGNLQFSGKAKLNPDPAGGDARIAQKDIETFLTNLDVGILFDGEQLRVDGSATSSAGGTIQAREMKVGLIEVFTALAGGDLEKFLNNGVSGNLVANGFQMSQGKGNKASSGSISGDLKLKGTIGEPVVTGDIVIESGNLTLPQIEEKPASEPSFIDPKFDIKMRTVAPVTLRAAAGQFRLTGDGTLGGSLQSPDFKSTLTVRGGSIRLPNARIAVEDGGEIKISYRSSSSGLITSRADVNIEGQTQLTAERTSGGVERYDIHLKIRGNLLEEKGVIITAESDPPDLSQGRIMALLGQGDFIRGLGLGNSNITEQFRNALIGVALPYLAGSFTDRLAQQLGLDYVNVEYNSFDHFSVTAAWAIGKNLILSGRRQLSSPIPGEGIRYDIRLTYRPSFGGSALRRVRFYIGTDQDRPWKIGVEYGIKF